MLNSGFQSTLTTRALQLYGQMRDNFSKLDDSSSESESSDGFQVYPYRPPRIDPVLYQANIPKMEMKLFKDQRSQPNQIAQPKESENRSTRSTRSKRKTKDLEVETENALLLDCSKVKGGTVHDYLSFVNQVSCGEFGEQEALDFLHHHKYDISSACSDLFEHYLVATRISALENDILENKGSLNHDIDSTKNANTSDQKFLSLNNITRSQTINNIRRRSKSRKRWKPSELLSFIIEQQRLSKSQSFPGLTLPEKIDSVSNSQDDSPLPTWLNELLLAYICRNGDPIEEVSHVFPITAVQRYRRFRKISTRRFPNRSSEGIGESQPPKQTNSKVAVHKVDEAGKTSPSHPKRESIKSGDQFDAEYVPNGGSRKRKISESQESPNRTSHAFSPPKTIRSIPNPKNSTKPNQTSIIDFDTNEQLGSIDPRNRERVRYNQMQVDILENAFQKDPWPDEHRRIELAQQVQELGSTPGIAITEMRMRWWFQNRRAKQRRSKDRTPKQESEQNIKKKESLTRNCSNKEAKKESDNSSVDSQETHSKISITVVKEIEAREESFVANSPNIATEKINGMNGKIETQMRNSTKRRRTHVSTNSIESETDNSIGSASSSYTKEGRLYQINRELNTESNFEECVTTLRDEIGVVKGFE